MKITKAKLKQIIKEEIRLSTGGGFGGKEELEGIYTQAGLTPEEMAQMPQYVNGTVDFYGTSSFQKLYNWFLDSGEMPYGIAKARIGDPDVWILETLEALGA
jgi:hypothetical protein